VSLVLENFCSHHANIRVTFEFFFDGKSLETFSGRKRTFVRRIGDPPKFLADLLWLALKGFKNSSTNCPTGIPRILAT
jgi:hypothetical protein